MRKPDCTLKLWREHAEAYEARYGVDFFVECERYPHLGPVERERLLGADFAETVPLLVMQHLLYSHPDDAHTSTKIVGGYRESWTTLHRRGRLFSPTPTGTIPGVEIASLSSLLKGKSVSGEECWRFSLSSTLTAMAESGCPALSTGLKRLVQHGILISEPQDLLPEFSADQRRVVEQLLAHDWQSERLPNREGIIPKELDQHESQFFERVGKWRTAASASLGPRGLDLE